MSFLFLFIVPLLPLFVFFFFNDTATTEIYTLSLHDALPIYSLPVNPKFGVGTAGGADPRRVRGNFVGEPTDEPRRRCRAFRLTRRAILGSLFSIRTVGPCLLPELSVPPRPSLQTPEADRSEERR